jgi:hypothetical protein
MSRTTQARKAKAKYGKNNLRQYPVRVNDDNPYNDRLPCGEFAEDVISPALPYMGYKKMRIQYNIDLLDLSALTSFHVCHATVRVLSRQPLHLIDALRCAALATVREFENRRITTLSYICFRFDGSTGPCSKQSMSSSNIPRVRPHFY